MLGDLRQPSPWRHAGAALQTASRSVAREIAFLPNIPPAGVELRQELGREFGDAAVLGCSHLAPALHPAAVSPPAGFYTHRCPAGAQELQHCKQTWLFPGKKKKKSSKKKRKKSKPSDSPIRAPCRLCLWRRVGLQVVGAEFLTQPQPLAVTLSPPRPRSRCQRLLPSCLPKLRA